MIQEFKRNCFHSSLFIKQNRHENLFFYEYSISYMFEKPRKNSKSILYSESTLLLALCTIVAQFSLKVLIYQSIVYLTFLKANIFYIFGLFLLSNLVKLLKGDLIPIYIFYVQISPQITKQPCALIKMINIFLLRNT